MTIEQPLPLAPRATVDVQRIDAWFAPRGPQRRWTVLIRIILLIPQLVALWVLWLVALVVTVIGWFGALAIGRLPKFAEEFLSGCLLWQARVLAYSLLLNDRYPAFSLEALRDDPIRLAIRPGPLNRLAVLLRIFLLIPAGVVADVVSTGAGLLSIAGWVATLATGTLPRPLHQALAASARLQTRYLGYATMLSATYPWFHLFGDEPAPGAPAPEEPAAASAPIASVTAPPEVATANVGHEGETEAPRPDGGGEGGGADRPQQAAPTIMPDQLPAGEATSAPDPAVDGPRSPKWRLLVDSGGRVALILVLILGVLGAAGYSTAVATDVLSSPTPQSALSGVDAAYSTLEAQVSSFNTTVSNCTTLGCARHQATVMAFDLRQFSAAISGVGYPPSAQSAADGLVYQASIAAITFDRLASAVSLAQYAVYRGLTVARLDIVSQSYQALNEKLDSLK